MNDENKRAAQHAQENVRRLPEDYDDEGRPAASRARNHDASEEGPDSTTFSDEDDRT
ncbi:hypothetical protein [Actinomycetospora cinnamomea]|uniref:Uncharacterized protein n=1 Tax=Actinomycetospora cinnamomea TaxID=663609 RepID=A0A2U1F3T6_9PSEU|nr:hypothetical protein [Actinomycetospora cinnamomea]PVZ06845.1 hypothetical protein C8D89_11238 [Actinomycetospora cinnamomea]